MSEQTQLATAPARAIRVVEDHSAAAYLFDTARFEHMFRIAKAMAQATLIPEHLWKDKTGSFPPEQVIGNCFLIVNQAVRWGMDPFAVAPETYCARGKLGFQGKLVAAVVNARAGTKERLNYSFTGAGDALTVTVSGTFEGEEKPRTVTLSVKDAKTDNDMWRKDPEQKLIYSGATKWARRHCPEVILGVLTDDDVERIAASRAEKDLEDPKVRARDLALRDREATEKYNERLRAQGVQEDQLEPLPTEEPEPSSTSELQKATPLEGLQNLMKADGITEKAVLKIILDQHGSSPGSLSNLRPEMASALITAWPDIIGKLKELSKS